MEDDTFYEVKIKNINEIRKLIDTLLENGFAVNWTTKTGIKYDRGIKDC